MTPILVSSHVESIHGGRKEQLRTSADAVMEFKVEHEFRGAKAGDLNLVLFNTKYTIGAPSIISSANFELAVVHTARFKIDSPLTDELGTDSDFQAQMINSAGPLAQAQVSELLSKFGLNADVPFSRPTETPNELPKRLAKKASTRKPSKSQV